MKANKLTSEMCLKELPSVKKERIEGVFKEELSHPFNSVLSVIVNRSLVKQVTGQVIYLTKQGRKVRRH